jgi:hypothetical protein
MEDEAESQQQHTAEHHEFFCQATSLLSFFVYTSIAFITMQRCSVWSSRRRPRRGAQPQHWEAVRQARNNTHGLLTASSLGEDSSDIAL